MFSSTVCETEGAGHVSLQKIFPFFLFFSIVLWGRQRNVESISSVDKLQTWHRWDNTRATDLEASSFCCSRILCWASQLAFSSSNTRLFSSSSLYCASRFRFICSWRRSSCGPKRYGGYYRQPENLSWKLLSAWNSDWFLPSSEKALF